MAKSGSLTEQHARRERSHRRLTLVAIGALIVLGTSPVYVHHLFSFGATQVFAGIDHVGSLCLTALHLLLLPVHRGFHVVLLAGVAFAVWDRVRAWRTGATALAALEWRTPALGDAFWTAARATGADPKRIRIVAGLPNPAFTAGLWSPTIFLATELADRLSAEELVTVVAHEAAHVARRDPLRLFLLRLLGCVLFWIPALRRLADDFADEAEVMADDAAASGRPLVLASAILALANWGDRRVTPPLTVGFQRNDLLERRIRRLAGEPVSVHSHLTRRSIVGAAFALGVVWSSGVVMAHPLPSSASGVAGHPAHEALVAHHCEHERESAFAHLFCLGSPFSARAHSDCPHAR